MAFRMNEAETPPCLKNMDVLLRCPICFDFLNITMMTKCSHNFCSLCIRKYLSYKLQCPVCNSQMTEQDLQNNRIVDDMIVNFQTVRQQLSKASCDTPPVSPETSASAFKSRTPGQRDPTPKKDSSIRSHFFQKGPKTLNTTTAPCVPQGKGKPHTQIPSNGDLHNPTAPPTITVDEDEPMEAVVIRAPNRRIAAKLENVDEPISAPQPSEAETFSSSEDQKPGTKVDCPVCSVGISPNFINKHLDACLTSGLKKEGLRSSGGSRMRPKGKLVYDLLSLQVLKKKLKECHLSVHGSREQLVRKHKAFVHIYNAQCDAQCDSFTPKSAEDIAREVEANEKSRSELQRKAKPVMVFSKNQPEEEIDTMHSNYRKKNGSEFSRLISQVRGRMESNRRPQIKHEDHKEGDEVREAQTAVQATELKDCSNLPDRVFMTSDETGGDSDASISSSISDIFGSEPHPSIENVVKTRKRASCSREEDAETPFVLGKRKCKTLRENR